MDGTTYKYDEVGNVNDDAAQNLTMAWTPQNKLLNTTGPDIKTEYLYYGDGNLARKYITGVTYDEFGKKVPEDRYIFYIRDASGNLIGLYETDLLATTPTFDVKERYIYGTEMLAVMKGENSGESVPDLEYMLKDHLGNVRVMLGENHTEYPSTLDIKSYNNNYAFGAPHPFRNFNLLDQRHAFNGQEKPNEIKGVGLHYSFKAREYDPVYGRFWSRDKYDHVYPGETTYGFAGNNPIYFIDKDGNLKYAKGKEKLYTSQYPALTIFLSQHIQQSIYNSNMILGGLMKRGVGKDDINRLLHWDPSSIVDVQIVPASRFLGGMWSAHFAGALDWRGKPSGGTLFLNEEIVKQFEQAYKDNPAEAGPNLFVTYESILHEMAHWARFMSSGHNYDADHHVESGYEFIDEVYLNGIEKRNPRLANFIRQRETASITIQHAQAIISFKLNSVNGWKDLPRMPGIQFKSLENSGGAGIKSTTTPGTTPSQQRTEQDQPSNIKVIIEKN